MSQALLRLSGAIMAAFLLASPAAMAACGTPEGVEATPFKPQNADRTEVGADYDKIVERGYVEIGVYEDFPPYSFMQDGELTGIDVEIGRLVAADLGVEARIRALPAGETVDADFRNWVSRGPVTGGRVVNVLMRAPWHPDLACRNELIVLMGQYDDEEIGVAYGAETYPDGAPTPPYFRFDKVGVENDSLADFYLSGFMGGILLPNIRRYVSTTEAMDALKIREVSAVMGPMAQLEWGARETPGLKAETVPLPGLAMGRWRVGVALRHNYRQLAYAVEDAINAAMADGRMAAIFAHYGVAWSPPEW